MNLNFETNYDELFNEGHDLEDVREWLHNGIPAGLLLDDESFNDITPLGALLSETAVAYVTDLKYDMREQMIESVSAEMRWAREAAGLVEGTPLHKQVRTLAAAHRVARSLNEFLSSSSKGAKVIARETVTSKKGKTTRRVRVELPTGETAWVTDTSSGKRKR